MLGGLAQHRLQVLAVGVDRPGHERRLGADGQRDRVERLVQRAHRRRLGDLADLGGGGVLALGQPVDPVVEQQDVQVDVAAQRVDQVVAADRQRVAVTGDHPHRQVGPARRPARSRSPARGRGSSGSRRCSGSTGTARSSRCPETNTMFSRLQPELGQEALHRGQDRVVTAAGAPADLLVGLEVLQALLGVRLGDERAGPSRLIGLSSLSITSWMTSGQLLGLERKPAHAVVADDVDEEAGAQQQRELAEVDLRQQHLVVARAAPRRCWRAAG